jgi:hypothetical protein
MEVVHKTVSRSLDFVRGLGRSRHWMKDHRPFKVFPGRTHVSRGTRLSVGGLHNKQSHNGQNDTYNQSHFTALGGFFGNKRFSHEERIER